MNASIPNRLRPRFTRDELNRLWPRLNLGAQLTYNQLAKEDPFTAENYLRVQFDFLTAKHIVVEEDNLTPNQHKILKYLQAKGASTAGALQLALGIPLSAVYHYLGKLVELNLVVNLGKTKIFSTVTGRTSTADWVGLPGQKIPQSVLEDDRDYDGEILRALSCGGHTRKELSRKLNIEQSKIRSRLKAMVRQGRIRAIGLGKQSHGGHSPILYELPPVD